MPPYNLSEELTNLSNLLNSKKYKMICLDKVKKIFNSLIIYLIIKTFSSTRKKRRYSCSLGISINFYERLSLIRRIRRIKF